MIQPNLGLEGLGALCKVQWHVSTCWQSKDSEIWHQWAAAVTNTLKAWLTGFLLIHCSPTWSPRLLEGSIYMQSRYLPLSCCPTCQWSLEMPTQTQPGVHFTDLLGVSWSKQVGNQDASSHILCKKWCSPQSHGNQGCRWWNLAVDCWVNQRSNVSQMKENYNWACLLKDILIFHIIYLSALQSPDAKVDTVLKTREYAGWHYSMLSLGENMKKSKTGLVVKLDSISWLDSTQCKRMIIVA